MIYKRDNKLRSEQEKKVEKMIGPAVTGLGLLFAGIARLYLDRVSGGIRGGYGGCAPICESTVVIVFAFSGMGVLISTGASFILRRRRFWLCLAIIAIIMNTAACATWGYWINKGMLLPYDDFCKKVGIG